LSLSSRTRKLAADVTSTRISLSNLPISHQTAQAASAPAVAVLLSPISCCDVVAAFKMAAVARQNGARQRESAAAINVS